MKSTNSKKKRAGFLILENGKQYEKLHIDFFFHIRKRGLWFVVLMNKVDNVYDNRVCQNYCLFLTC